MEAYENGSSRRLGDAPVAPTDTESGVSLVPVEAPPDRTPALVYLARLAPGSRRAMRSALRTMARLLTADRCDETTCPWGALRYQHTAAVRAWLAERYAPATANRHLAALRAVLKEAFRLGHVGADEYHRAVDLPAVRGERLPAGRAISAGELRALFASCAEDSTPGGARDAALLALLYGGGLRRSEAVGLDVGDFDAATGAVRVVSGKGNKGRAVYLADGGRAAVEAWLEIRGPEPGPLLLPVDRFGRTAMRRLSAQTVYDRLRHRASRAGVAACSPHDCRRTFVGDLLDAGADLAVVQKLSGHANVATTARYDRRGEEAKRRAAGLLHVPHVDSATE